MKLKKKGGELKDIEIEEVSVVDAPANKRRFLLFKNDIEKTDTDIRIQTDGTSEGTKITVNGDEIKDLKSFYFSFYKPDEGEEMYIDSVYASYMIIADADGGFTHVTYTLSKKEGATMDIAKLTEEQIAKMDEESQKFVKVLKQYAEMMPEDLIAAVSHFIKDEPEETPKEDEPAQDGGISDEERAKWEALREQIDAVLNPVTEEEKAAADVAKRDAKLDKVLSLLEKVEEKPPAEKQKEPDEEPGEIIKSIDELTKRLALIETNVTGKQGIESTEVGKQDGKDNFTSIDLS